ncbi:hypothetical protein [Rhizobium sp. C1]|uniref:hypothetical protein n=1 Tax=Rhizobium sp. C1 TaxID=1349799 RepID=UPI001E5C1BD0|nr:hypothetical protein [Rhizobium sp. C1]MCD2177949.1 hypothetical protein [Rhizobium sp. C1]
MKRHAGDGTMRISWDKDDGTKDQVAWQTDWSAAAGDLEDGLPLHSGRALTWLSAVQGIIQFLGILLIIYACLR